MVTEEAHENFATMMPTLRELMVVKPPISADDISATYDLITKDVIISIRDNVIGSFYSTRDITAMLLGMEASMRYGTALNKALNTEFPSTIAAIIYALKGGEVTITPKLLEEIAASGLTLHCEGDAEAMTYALRGPVL